MSSSNSILLYWGDTHWTGLCRLRNSFCFAVLNAAGKLFFSVPIGANLGTWGRFAGIRICPADGADRFAAFNGHGAVFLDRTQSYATV